MNKKYNVGADQGFGEDKTINVFIFKDADTIDDNEELVKGKITKVEIFESAFETDEQIKKFKKLVEKDLDVGKLPFVIIPRGDMRPENDRPEFVAKQKEEKEKQDKIDKELKGKK